jgi:hypothetical protein
MQPMMALANSLAALAVVAGVAAAMRVTQPPAAIPAIRAAMCHWTAWLETVIYV